MYGRYTTPDYFFKAGSDFIGNANGAGKPMLVQDFKSVNFDVFGDVASSMTVKFVKSNQEAMPDFGSASSLTNDWDFVEVVDLNDGTTYDGNVGLTITPNYHKSFEFNMNAAKWVGAIISGYAAGAITITTRAFNNE